MDSDYCSFRARSVYPRTDDLPGCLSCEGMVNLLYLVHVMGIFIGPVAGRLSHRYGSSRRLVSGLVIPAISIAITLLASLATIVIGPVVIYAGFFTMHAAAVGLLSEKGAVQTTS